VSRRARTTRQPVSPDLPPRAKGKPGLAKGVFDAIELDAVFRSADPALPADDGRALLSRLAPRLKPGGIAGCKLWLGRCPNLGSSPSKWVPEAPLDLH